MRFKGVKKVIFDAAAEKMPNKGIIQNVPFFPWDKMGLATFFFGEFRWSKRLMTALMGKIGIWNRLWERL